MAVCATRRQRWHAVMVEGSGGTPQWPGVVACHDGEGQFKNFTLKNVVK